MKLFKNNQHGRSMVEMLGVLAIIGVLSVGGIAGYSKAMYKQKMNKTVDIVSKVLMGVNEWASNNLGMANTLSKHSLAIKLGILDKSLCNNRDECTLPIGGKISVYFDTIEIDLTGISNPVNLCIDLLSHRWENALSGNSKYISAVTYMGGHKYIYSTRTDIGVKLEYTLADIKNACDQACNNNYGRCYIYFGMQLTHNT